MAVKKTSVPDSVALQAAEETEKALAAIPQDLQDNAGQGVETIGQDDVRPPRLLICQAGSPQRKPDDPKQIIGLNELDMFNDLSGEIYGRGPLKIVIVQALGARHIQFAPMEEGGGVLDYDVKPTDPRALFTTNEKGERVKPVATKFYDYLAWLPDYQDIIAWSLKSSQLKIALRVNGMMKLPLKFGGQVHMKPPAWARTFSLTTAMEKSDSFSWGSYNLKNEGVTDEDTREICKTLYDSYSKKNVVIERDDHDDDTLSNAQAEAGM